MLIIFINSVIIFLKISNEYEITDVVNSISFQTFFFTGI